MTTPARMKERYEALYQASNTYWGTQPSPVALLALSHRKGKTVLDIGCGQGPDTRYFASKGLHVTAIDISGTAIEQLRASTAASQVDAREQDMQEIGTLPVVDIVFSRMALQMIPPSERKHYIARLQNKFPNALHAHVVPISGACFGDAFICEDTLLKEAYAQWDILLSEDAWTLSRVPNDKGEHYLMRESRIIAQAKP